MEEVIVKEDFFDTLLIDELWEELKKLPRGRELYTNGPFSSQLMAVHQTITDYSDLPATEKVTSMVKALFDIPVTFSEVVYCTLYKPWDVHSDEEGVETSHYNVLIPLHDVESGTIIFNQRSNMEIQTFADYKAANPKVDVPISLDFWKEKLHFCWPEDREYLTIHTICPYQKKGQLVAFRSNLFHSSDNWYIRKNEPKHFLQILVNTIK